MKQNWICKLLLIFILLSTQSIAADALDYSILSLHSRAEALGNAAVAHNLGQGSVFINPANIITDKQLEIISSTGKMFEDYTKYSIGFARQLLDKKTFIGINYTGAEIDGLKRVEKIDDRPEVLYESSDSRSVFIATMAHRFNKKLNFGMNLKFYRHQMFEQSASAMSIDLGGQYQIIKNLKAGGCYRNITGSKLSWTTGHDDDLEKEMQLGLSLKGKLIFWDTYFNIDNVYNRHNETIKNYGAEIWLLKEVLALRAGKNDDQVKFGLGLNVNDMFVDYVYSDHQDLAESHKISLGAYF